MNDFRLATICAVSLALATGCTSMQKDSGFVPLFDGKTLNGWTAPNKTGSGYYVKDGVMICPTDEHGNLYTEKEFENFVLRLDFKLRPGANSGVGIRAPISGDPIAYSGTEIQILDDGAPQYANLEPGQYCGSVYKVFPAKRGALKPTGEWNHYEITVNGRQFKVVLNGKTIVNGNANDVKNPEILRQHPGLFRDKGHIALLSHKSFLEFRNIEIKELPASHQENTPPTGFGALFNGRDLSGWKGLVADPPRRAKMTAAELASAQTEADRKMRDHWKVENGVLVFDGKGENLCTLKDYANFELLVDWKIPAKGDSGIYLRGTPQVQIWEPNSPGQFNPPHGSGGLYNNEKHPRKPLKFADRPVGEWNRFRIMMVGERVHVYLNDELVVKDTVLENYWERAKPIYPTGSIELQNHGGPLYFKNIYVREIPAN